MPCTSCGSRNLPKIKGEVALLLPGPVGVEPTVFVLFPQTENRGWILATIRASELYAIPFGLCYGPSRSGAQ